jgi:hypothetical protein
VSLGLVRCFQSTRQATLVQATVATFLDEVSLGWRGAYNLPAGPHTDRNEATGRVQYDALRGSDIPGRGVSLGWRVLIIYQPCPTPTGMELPGELGPHMK